MEETRMKKKIMNYNNLSKYINFKSLLWALVGAIIFPLLMVLLAKIGLKFLVIIINSPIIFIIEIFTKSNDRYILIVSISLLIYNCIIGFGLGILLKKILFNKKKTIKKTLPKCTHCDMNNYGNSLSLEQGEKRKA
jgi:hypothetical protein